ncbi:hypothetical protein ACOMHN_041713 [Nucella lapillus]
MTSHLPGEGITPGLQLYLVDSDDEPLDERDGGSRRPSTASLSRFRSCPQLSSADTHAQDSPGSDDHGLGAELCVGSVQFTHGSPRPRQRYHRDDLSQTPTPPSTPGSRRSHTSIKDAPSSSAAGKGGGGGVDSAAVAAALPRALGRARREHAFLGRTCSTDTPAFQFYDDNHLRSDDQQSGSRPLSEFNEEPPEVSIDGRLTSTEDGALTPLGRERVYHHTDQDSMDKCARWLQSLKMTSGDRLKSRSHIQLPPI